LFNDADDDEPTAVLHAAYAALGAAWLNQTALAQVTQRAWLNQVAVLPTDQRVGIASELWRLRCEWSRAHEATSVGVDTAVATEHLVRLYCTWRFEQVSAIHWSAKTYDSVVMIRPLGPADTV